MTFCDTNHPKDVMIIQMILVFRVVLCEKPQRSLCVVALHRDAEKPGVELNMG